MSIREALGMLWRDVPPAFRRVGYFVLAAIAIYRATPAIAAVLGAPAQIDRMDDRITALEAAQEQSVREYESIKSDLSRAICLLEIVTERRSNPLDCR